MRRATIFGLGLVVLNLSGAAVAEDPPRSPPQTRPGMMMQDRKGNGMMHRDDAMSRHHHRRSCFDAAWQSEAWKRCEAMMGARKEQG